MSDFFSGITSATFMPIVDVIVGLLPIAVPVVVALMGFRKGWAWLRGQIKGA